MSHRIPKAAYAIIIGAMKCGTTSLFNYIQGHPQICPAMIKEPEFFSEHQDHGAQVASYEDLWTFDISVHKYALEASTGYTKYPAEPNVAKNIFEYGITPKFIYLIRNPYDRITSHYNFMRKHATWQLGVSDTHLIHTSDYFLQLEQYRKYFRLQDILILDFDELRDNPATLVGRTYDFLGLEHDYFPTEYEAVNVTPTQVRSRFEKRLRKSKLSAIFQYVPRPLKRIGNRLMPSRPLPPKRVLTQEERSFIHDALNEDMVRLQGVYGFDVRKWGF